MTCDVCNQRPARYTVPIFRSWDPRETRKAIREEHWCEECHDAILARHPGETLWRHRDGWFGPKPTAKERALLGWPR